MKLEDKLYWGRFAGGVLMGFLTEFLKLDRFGVVNAIVIAAFAYLISALIIRSLLRPETREALGRKLYFSGVGTYAALWLLTWILSFNLIERPPLA